MGSEEESHLSKRKQLKQLILKLDDEAYRLCFSELEHKQRALNLQIQNHRDDLKRESWAKLSKFKPLQRVSGHHTILQW